MEELIFEKCVDSKLLDNPLVYCNKTIIGNLNLTLWTASHKIKACNEGGDLIQTQCNQPGSKECYPCAYTISYIFSKYEKYIVTVMEGTFSILSKRAATSLHSGI